jgi:outer membrane lipoprotein carrier protein
MNLVADALILPARAEGQQEQDVGKVARLIDRHYNQLQTLQADFEESYRGAGISRSETGVLWLKRPGKMRWEYRTPREKLFITTAKTAFFYVLGEQQARKAPLEKFDDLRSPLRYLLGKTKLEKEFDNLHFGPPTAAGELILEGVPKGMQERVRRVRIGIGPGYDIRSIVMEEVDGSVTEFRFSNTIENAAVSDDKFRFRPPPGVEVISASDITP